MHDDTTAFIQIIIVTWNKKADILRLLNNLSRIAYPEERFDTVVVDNNSADGTSDAIAAAYPDVQLIRNHQNLGGAGGFNTGMRWAMEHRPEAEFFWLLDNDVLVDSNSLKALVSAMKLRPGAGICGSRIMDMDHPEKVVEVGAFLDFRIGDVRRNEPNDEELEDSDILFDVDYVAACSLLVRASLVRKLGLWHARFFIYWDDMEWGARFKKAGYDVLAAGGSVVYHPNWVGRTIDHSVIWRNYYRVRNGLWFFNNYCSGMKRRFLLARMALRFTAFSFSSRLNANIALSQAFEDGIQDFLRGIYGKKEFDLSPEDSENKPDWTDSSLCLFIPDAHTSEDARKWIQNISHQYSGIQFYFILSDKDMKQWRNWCSNGEFLTYKRKKSGVIPWIERLRIIHFLVRTPWDMMITPPLSPKMGSIRGKPVARVDFKTGKVLSVQPIILKELIGILASGLKNVLKMLVNPPNRDMDCDTC